MEQEIGIRIKKYKSIEFFIPKEKATLDEIKKYAKDHLGEYRGKVTKTWYRVFTIPKTVAELRRKWMRN